MVLLNLRVFIFQNSKSTRNDRRAHQTSSRIFRSESLDVYEFEHPKRLEKSIRGRSMPFFLQYSGYVVGLFF